ncbi:MAG: cation:proton antiporter, partial [Mariniblastus sp.]|nr:cation:proton antiporter [Mariniblastus sp.]
AKRDKQQFLDAAEGIGDALALVTWFVFGAAAIGLTWHQLTWQIFAYALLCLTVVRIIPVFICLFGTKLKFETKLFIGWFGPRGLASIVFIVLVQDKSLPGSGILVTTVTWTILLSVLLHGLSANPLSRFYGKRIDQAGGKI